VDAADENNDLIRRARELVQQDQSRVFDPALQGQLIGTLVGHEKEFVKDKPVENPKSFHIEMHRGNVYVSYCLASGNLD
jgi:hypothetical protein